MARRPASPSSPQTDARPDDLLPLRAAAALVGRTVDTIRDWRTRYGLRDWRDPTKKGAPSLVSRADLLTVAARAAAARPDASGVVDGVVVPSGSLSRREPSSSTSPQTSPQGGSPDGVPYPLASLAPILAELAGERDRLRVERDTATAAALALRDRVTELETLLVLGRRSAVEDEARRIRVRRRDPAASPAPAAPPPSPLPVSPEKPTKKPTKKKGRR
jgi:hypothetical protein